MEYIRFFKNINKNDVSIAGGKGASLGELTNAKIPVPPGFVILASSFEKFIKNNNLGQEIQARLAEVHPDDINSVEKASKILRDVIHDTPMSEDLNIEITQAYEKLGDSFVAVRSSATAEDSEIASWAGELETYLNTTRETLHDHVKKCWSSLFTPRAIFYRHEKGLIDAQVDVAVVVQKMIQSDVSGVAFTVHPVTEDRDQIIIEACFGLGEAIVSGAITPDSYVLSKSKRTLLDVNIGKQRKKLVQQKAGAHGEANFWVDLTEDEAQKQKLGEDQIFELTKLCKKIEDHYGFPCDIEWAFADDTFFITQSRPITTLKQ